MKPTSTFAKSILILLLLIAIDQSCFAQQTIHISNVWELYKNIGSNRILELDTGVYDLGILLDQQYKENTILPPNPRGAEILNVHDLKILGGSNGRTKIVVNPRYGWTVYFRNCKNVQLSNIIFGHSPASYCKGGVLKFVGCNNVEINYCDLFGSGTIGMALDSCSDFKINETTIHDCTNGLVDLYTSYNIRFNKVHFKNTRGGVTFMNTPEIYFSKCDFENNDASGMIAFFYLWPQYYVMEAAFATEEELKKTVTIKTKVYLDSCTVQNNVFHSFTNDRRKLSINGTKMEKNTIPKEQ